MHVLFDDDAYDRLAPALQCVLAHALNQILKQHGIDDAARRRSICENYLFETGVLLDQNWLKTTGAKRVFPRLCFTDRRLVEDEEADAKAKVYFPAGGFEFHSAAFGSVGYYFDRWKEKLKDIKTGD
jgi:hypothetical protein